MSDRSLERKERGWWGASTTNPLEPSLKAAEAEAAVVELEKWKRRQLKDRRHRTVELFRFRSWEKKQVRGVQTEQLCTW